MGHRQWAVGWAWHVGSNMMSQLGVMIWNRAVMRLWWLENEYEILSMGNSIDNWTSVQLEHCEKAMISLQGGCGDRLCINCIWQCVVTMPPHVMPHPSKKNTEVWEKHTLFRRGKGGVANFSWNIFCDCICKIHIPPPPCSNYIEKAQFIGYTLTRGKWLLLPGKEAVNSK